MILWHQLSDNKKDVFDPFIFMILWHQLSDNKKDVFDPFIFMAFKNIFLSLLFH